LKELEELDKTEVKEGCRWTIVFAFGGINFVLLAFNAVTLTFGVWYFNARLLGFCCSCLLGCVNIAAIVTTAVFRFNTFGRLASLSTSPARYDPSSPSDDFYLSDKLTYADDGALILGIWIA
jgi:hypothetical protein